MHANHMKTFDLIQATMSHNLKEPHSKALEPDRLSPRLAIAAQPLKGLGGLDYLESNSVLLNYRFSQLGKG